jgi:hypothetical protein
LNHQAHQAALPSAKVLRATRAGRLTDGLSALVTLVCLVVQSYFFAASPKQLDRRA